MPCVEHMVGDLDALRGVDLAQAFAQPRLAVRAFQFAFDQAIGVADRVHHVHRQHGLVKRGRGRGLPARQAQAFVAATTVARCASFAMRCLPSSTERRISSQFCVAACASRR